MDGPTCRVSRSRSRTTLRISTNTDFARAAGPDILNGAATGLSQERSRPMGLDRERSTTRAALREAAPRSREPEARSAAAGVLEAWTGRDSSFVPELLAAPRMKPIPKRCPRLISALARTRTRSALPLLGRLLRGPGVEKWRPSLGRRRRSRTSPASVSNCPTTGCAPRMPGCDSRASDARA